MPRRGISVSVTMHVNSGVRTLNPASLPNPIYGVWRTQVWRHSMASSLSELQQHFLKRKVWRLIPIGWWSTADRPCLLGQTIKAQHAFAMAADGDHYILTFNAPVNVEDVYVRIEFHLPADARQGLHRCQGRIHVPTGICTHTMSYADYMHVYKVCIKTKQDDLGICQGFRGLWLG